MALNRDASYIFEDDQDRRRFLETLTEACQKTGWQVQASTEQITAKSGARHDGEIVQEAAEKQAEGLVRAGLKRLQWTERDLSVGRKGDPGKVPLADELRAKTAMPLVWVADRLKMGSRGYLTWLLYRDSKAAK